MKADEVVARIKSVLPAANVEPEGADCSFSVVVVSDEFAGQLPVKRQQRVLAAFEDLFASGELHALSVKAMTSDEAEAARKLTTISL